MSSAAAVTVVERCTVCPPPCSVPPATLPLTFFDIPWLFFSPSQPIFFFSSAASAAHSEDTILPNLKHSLSLTLRHFFPLAGKLVVPAAAMSVEPHLEYKESDSIPLIVAEAAADGGEFKNLVGNHHRMGRHFNSLVPELAAGEGSKRALLAVQITIFAGTGFCMGFTLRNVVADWRTFNNFLKEWASLCKSGGNKEERRHVAFHDRSVMLDPCGLRSTFLKEFWKIKNNTPTTPIQELKPPVNEEVIRATFVLGPKEMEQIKKQILTRLDLTFGSAQLLLSPYVIACSFIWVCWIKAHWCGNDQNVNHYFGFIAGGLTRLPFAVPNTYVGNCVGFGRSWAGRRDLKGENGIVFAAKAIGDTIKKLNGDMLSGGRDWISEWMELRESELHVTVTGSPKLDLYELDFGWGRPLKFEEVSINRVGGISLSDSREVIGGIEIGVALPELRMDAFTAFFNNVV